MPRIDRKSKGLPLAQVLGARNAVFRINRSLVNAALCLLRGSVERDELGFVGEYEHAPLSHDGSNVNGIIQRTRSSIALAVTVRCVDDDHVYARLNQQFDALFYCPRRR